MTTTLGAHRNNPLAALDVLPHPYAAPGGKPEALVRTAVAGKPVVTLDTLLNTKPPNLGRPLPLRAP